MAPTKSYQPSISNDLHRALFDDGVDALFVVDETGCCVAANRRAAGLTGYTADELIGTPMTDLTASLPARHRAAADDPLSAAAREAVLRRKDGTLVPVEAIARSLRDGHQLQVVRDVSARREAEASIHALEASEELYRSLVESAQDLFFTSDADGRYLYVNAAAAANLGMTPDQVIGRKAEELFPPHIAERYQQGVRHVIRTGETLIAEDLSQGTGGEPKWFSTIVQPVRNRHGQITAAQALVRDITSLKKTEEALRKSEERLRQAVRVAHIGIFDHDHAAGSLYMSSSMREIIGLGPDVPISVEEFASHRDGEPAFLATVHPDDRERIARAFERAHLGPDGIYDVQYRSIRLDGAVRWVAVRAQTFFEGADDARRPVRTVGAVIDITERKRAEEERERLQAQLLQAQKMESVGRLAGGVAHDFNNMLNVICGYADLALDQLEPSPELVDALEEIRRAARRSANLTRQLLAFARMQTVEPEVLDLNEVIDGSLNMLRRVIGEHISTVWSPGQDLWSVSIDPTQIDQLLVNLSLNARDAITDVGRITIATSNVVLDDAFCALNPGAVPGDYVMLEVTDDGCGIDRDAQDYIFEPFFTTKPKGKGTGLGLATVYGIVQQNRGLIAVASQVGQGTSVRIWLPRTHEAAAVEMLANAANVSQTTNAPQTGHEMVLLVEDEPMVLHLSQRLLESLGYDVVPAGSPRDALRVAEALGDRFDLLITDMVMPDMNGRDLALALRSRYPRLKCMFMSGYFAGSPTLAGMVAEGAHVLQKPFTIDELAAKVRDVLDA